MNRRKFLKKFLCTALSLSLAFVPVSGASFIRSEAIVSAAEDIAHDPDRDVQKYGVGNPFNYGERNTPENGSDEEIRAINHAMTVQEVKYCMYKEIDEHWDLIKVRFGQENREMVYALFLGLGSRESTLGGNGDGADLETAHSEGFGVSSAHAYGTMQTAVTAFRDCDPTFMKEDDVPEMFQYTLTHANFYDAVISNHMGIRKLMHFVRSAIVDYNLEGYQVVRAALKAFNTGWANYTGEDDGYYKNYPDEIVSLARWYYEEGHLYDNVFTWTTDKRADQYRQGNVWEWWGSGVPSLAEITPSDSTQEPDTPQVTEPDNSGTQDEFIKGDADGSGVVDLTDLTLIAIHSIGDKQLEGRGFKAADVDNDGKVGLADLARLRQYLSKKIQKL